MITEDIHLPDEMNTPSMARFMRRRGWEPVFDGESAPTPVIVPDHIRAMGMCELLEAITSLPVPVRDIGVQVWQDGDEMIDRADCTDCARKSVVARIRVWLATHMEDDCGA
jgi:hypothetical protein